LTEFKANVNAFVEQWKAVVDEKAQQDIAHFHWLINNRYGYSLDEDIAVSAIAMKKTEET